MGSGMHAATAATDWILTQCRFCDKTRLMMLSSCQDRHQQCSGLAVLPFAGSCRGIVAVRNSELVILKASSFHCLRRINAFQDPRESSGC